MGTDTAARPGDQTATATETEPTGERWYRSPWVVAAVGVDVVLTVALAAGTTVIVQDALGEGIPGAYLFSLDIAVPWEVYAFGVLGAFGYVFTALLRDFERTPLKVVQYHLRVPAAVPLAAGVYLLSGLILGTGTTAEGSSGGAAAFVVNETLVVGLAFLSGLYVNLAYERLSALADRLLPDREADDETSTSGEPSGSDG